MFTSVMKNLVITDLFRTGLTDAQRDITDLYKIEPCKFIQNVLMGLVLIIRVVHTFPIYNNINISNVLFP